MKHRCFSFLLSHSRSNNNTPPPPPFPKKKIKEKMMHSGDSRSYSPCYHNLEYILIDLLLA